MKHLSKLFLASLASMTLSGAIAGHDPNGPQLHKKLKPRKNATLSLIDVKALPSQAETPDRAEAVYHAADGTVVKAALADVNNDGVFAKNEISTLTIENPARGDHRVYTSEGAERAGSVTVAHKAASGEMLATVKTDLQDGMVAKIYKDFYRLIKH